MAIKSQYSALLGYDPRQDELDRRKLWAGMYGAASSPYEKIGLGLSQLGGALFDKVTGSEEQNPAVQLEKLATEAASQFSPNSPEYYSYIASNTSNPTIKANAAQLGLQAEEARNKTMREEVKFYNENFTTAPDRLQELAARIEANPNDKNALKQYNAVASAYQQGFYEDQRKDKEAPTTAADRGVYENFVRQAGGDVYTAGLAFNKYKEDQKRRENTPLTEGNVKSGDINTLNDSVEKKLDPITTKINVYNNIKNLVKLVDNNNTAAVPQLERLLTKLAGDNQISSSEVRQIANAGGIVEQTVGGIQKFTIGTPTTGKLKKILEVVDSFENDAVSDYNRKRDKLESVWNTSNLPEASIKAALGAKRVSSSDKAKADADKAREQSDTPKPQKMVTKRTASGKIYQVLEDQ